MENIKALDIFAARYTMELGLKNNLRTMHIDYHMSASRETWLWVGEVYFRGQRSGLVVVGLS